MTKDYEKEDVIKIDPICCLRLRGISLISIGILLFTMDKSSIVLCAIMFSWFSLFAGLAGLYFYRIEKRKHIKKNLLLVVSILNIMLAFIIVCCYYFSAELLHDFLIAIGCYSTFISLVFFIYLIYLFKNGLKLTNKVILLYLVQCIEYGIVPFIIFYYMYGNINSYIIKSIGTPIFLEGVLLLILLKNLYIIKFRDENFVQIIPISRKC